jgi:hypothetical protein
MRMSKLGGISSDTQSLLRQQLRANAPHGAEKRKARLENALVAAGADPANLADLEQQIQAAIEAAQQSSTGTADPRSTVRSAIEQVLQDNGIDPAAFQQALKPRHHGGHKPLPVEDPIVAEPQPPVEETPAPTDTAGSGTATGDATADTNGVSVIA